MLLFWWLTGSTRQVVGLDHLGFTLASYAREGPCLDKRLETESRGVAAELKVDWYHVGGNRFDVGFVSRVSVWLPGKRFTSPYCVSCACSPSDIRSERPRWCSFLGFFFFFFFFGFDTPSAFCGRKASGCAVAVFVFIERLGAASPLSSQFTLSGWSSHRWIERAKWALSKLGLTNRKLDAPEAVTVPRARGCTY